MAKWGLHGSQSPAHFVLVKAILELGNASAPPGMRTDISALAAYNIGWFLAMFPAPRPPPLPSPVEGVEGSVGQWGSPGHCQGTCFCFAATGLMGDLGLGPWSSVFSSVEWTLIITVLLPPERHQGSHESMYCQDAYGGLSISVTWVVHHNVPRTCSPSRPLAAPPPPRNSKLSWFLQPICCVNLDAPPNLSEPHPACPRQGSNGGPGTTPGRTLGRGRC